MGVLDDTGRWPQMSPLMIVLLPDLSRAVQGRCHPRRVRAAHPRLHQVWMGVDR